MRHWRSSSKQVLFDHALFRLEHRTLECATEHRSSLPRVSSRSALVIESADWVQILPVLPNDELLMIRQFRYGSETVELEIPGGLVDPGETPEQAALRELREETGYEASRWSKIGTMSPNPAIMSNRLHVFVAEGLRSVGEPNGDEDEEIEIETVPRRELPRRIEHGHIQHGLVIASLMLFQMKFRESS